MYEDGSKQRPILDGLHQEPRDSTLTMTEETKPTVGWVCPVCNRGVAPSASFCPCVSTPIPTWPTAPYVIGPGYDYHWPGYGPRFPVTCK